MNIGDGNAAGIINAYTVYGGAGTATLNFNHSDSSYYFTKNGTASGSAVIISGSTSVNHIGSGTTHLTGNNSYSGNTTVEGGTLAITNGGKVSDSAGYIGFNAGSDGKVKVDGAGSSWSNSTDLYVGFSGSGVLDISNSGKVSNANGYIGYRSAGEAFVYGADSNWENNGDLTVGHGSTGTLAITNGGSVSNINGTIGYLSSGSVTVEGAGSSWDNRSTLMIGHYGSGKLDITDGGKVSDYNAYLGYSFGANGIVTVSGPGAIFQNNMSLMVGYNGNGSLAISDGGTVNSEYTHIGLNNNSIGTVTIDGVDSVLNSNKLIFVGINGGGTLDITNGAKVNSESGMIGGNSSGAVTVDGVNSSWSNSGNLIVGVNTNAGSLTVTHGATVNSLVGQVNGTVTIDGDGSSWNNKGGLAIGINLDGKLIISDGGIVNNQSSNLGVNAGSTGTVTLDGAGSEWNNTAGLDIGYKGAGLLTISNNAKANVEGIVTLGYVTGGSGTLNIGDGSAAGILNTTNVIGGDGAAALNFNHIDNAYYFTNNGASSGSAINISGSTAVNQIGSGTTYLTGNNSYTGGTTITNGTLQIGAGGTTGSIIGNITNDANLVFNRSNDLTYAGNINGAGSVTKLGNGTTYLTGIHAYTGDTNINAGKLIVNGSIIGDTFVNNGGTLGGSGSLGDVTVAGGGTISPGNSPGILTINGDLTLNSGATTLMEINGPTPGTDHDQINVTGSASLNGTLNLQFGAAPAIGSTYNLINAGNIILAGDAQNGFTAINSNITSNLGAALQLKPVIDADGIDGDSFDITIRQLSFITAANTSLTPNQRNVAANLDSFSTSGRGTTLIDKLNMLSAAQLPGGLNSLSGVQHTQTMPQAARVTRQFTHLLGDRLRLDASDDITASGFQNVQLAYNGEDTAMLFGTSVSGRPDSNLWMRAMGGFGDIDSDGNAPRASFNSSGMALGYDREWGDGLLGGLAFGYTHSNLNMNAGGAELDSYQLAAYGRKQWEQSYVGATFGIGHHRADSSRLISIGGMPETAKADYALNGVDLALEAGRHYALSENTKLTPYAGLEYGYFHQEDYREKGAGDASLMIDNDSMESLRSALGARLSNSFVMVNGTRFDTKLGLSWVHEFQDREAILKSAFAANSTVPFKVSGAETDRDRTVVNLGASAHLSKSARFDLDYRGEFADSDDQHAISATFRMAW